MAVLSITYEDLILALYKSLLEDSAHDLKPIADYFTALGEIVHLSFFYLLLHIHLLTKCIFFAVAQLQFKGTNTANPTAIESMLRFDALVSAASTVQLPLMPLELCLHLSTCTHS